MRLVGCRFYYVVRLGVNQVDRLIVFEEIFWYSTVDNQVAVRQCQEGTDRPGFNRPSVHDSSRDLYCLILQKAQR